MIALHGGTVYTVTQGVIEDGTVLIEGSRITAVGKRISIPDGCRVIDVAGKVIMPGMIDCIPILVLLLRVSATTEMTRMRLIWQLAPTFGL